MKLPAPLFLHHSEFDLLVACCADSSGNARADCLRKFLSRALDWDRVLHLVDHHRVVPQVYEALAPISHLVPSQPFDALRSRYQHNARKTLWFTAELLRILSHLESAGIKALPYKGPVLAQTLYGEVTKRQFGDLDILVLPEDVLKAKTALLDLGYKPKIELAPPFEKTYVETGYEYSFNAVHAQNLLELQWRIVPRFYSIDLNVADFLKRANEISLGIQEMEDRRPRQSFRVARGERQSALARPVRTLCGEDLLFVLCVHAAKHVWVQLSWLCDIAQLAKSQQLDWNAIQNEAHRLGIERIVNLNLLLAHSLLGAPLPPQIKQRLQQDPAATNLADEIQRIIQRSTHYNTESLPYFRLMMRLRERWQDQARLLWRLAFTPSVSEWNTVRLPQALHPLYRLVRLSRLARRRVTAG
jgi:hypothetical protein